MSSWHRAATRDSPQDRTSRSELLYASSLARRLADIVSVEEIKTLLDELIKLDLTEHDENEDLSHVSGLLIKLSDAELASLCRSYSSSNNAIKSILADALGERQEPSAISLLGEYVKQGVPGAIFELINILQDSKATAAPPDFDQDLASKLISLVGDEREGRYTVDLLILFRQASDEWRLAVEAHEYLHAALVSAGRQHNQRYVSI